jgi:hypothetical protein
MTSRHKCSMCNDDMTKTHAYVVYECVPCKRIESLVTKVYSKRETGKK